MRMVPRGPHAVTTLVVLAWSIAACGGGQRADEPDTVQMKDQVRESERRAAESRVVQPPPPQPAEEELAVEMINLRPDETVETQAGMVVTLTAASAPYSVTFARGGQREVVTYPRDPLYVEGTAFGELFTISKFGDDVQVTLRSDAPREPLSVEAALDIARRQSASQLGCESGDEETVVEDNGTVTLTVRDGDGGEMCHITVGRYTRRVVDL